MLGRLHAINSLDDTTEIMGSELLDLCKRNPNDLAKIKSVVENCPESATKYRDNDGRTALHVLCANRPSLQSVAFLAADPNSCRQRTSKGMLPLHYICREQASEDVVDFMLSQYPESVQVPTASGWFPLHLACARGSSLGVIQRLIQEWPESARQATQDGRMALHFACANHAPLQVVQLLVQQNWHAIQVQDRNQWTPLHIACAYSRNLDIIRYLVDEWKDGMLCHGKLKQLPLHVACWEGQELPIVNFLVEACPQAVLMRDSNSRLPLHCACQGNAGMPVIQYLIVQAPASALELGETVEEIAVYSMNKGVSQNAPSPQPAWCEWLKQNVPAFENESVDVTTFPVISKTTEKEEPISLNLQKRGNAKQSTNKQEISESLAVLTPSNVAAVGTLKQPQTQAQLIAHKQINLTSDQNQRPRRGQKQRTKSPQNESNKKHAPEVVSVGKTLHEACERPQSLNEIVRLLSEKPAAIEVTTYNNMLPIHTASLNEASAEILEALISFSPHSVCQQDVEGNLPIHLACYSGATFESIEVLVKQWPASLEMKNTQGQTPLDKARSPFLHDPDYQIISYLESQISRNLQARPGSQSSGPDQLELSPSQRMSTLDSIDLDVLSSKLNALRTTEMRQMAQNDQKSGFEATHAVKSNYSQTRPTTQTFRTPTRSTGDDDKIAYSQYKPNMMSRPSNTAKVSASPTVSPLRGGQSNRSQSSTPANRAPSPYGTNRRFASPAKIFGGRSSRGSSPSPVMKIAGFFRRKGKDSRHASPMRKSETSVPSVATTSVAAKRRSSNELSFLSDFAVNSFRSSINTVDSSGQDILLPPRPTSIVVSTKCSKGTTEHFTQLRDTPKPKIDHVDEYRSQSGRTSPSPRRPVVMKQTNAIRTFDSPATMEAGALTSRASRPGAVAVKEPVIRPDSAMYRTVNAGRVTNHVPTSRQNQQIPLVGSVSQPTRQSNLLQTLEGPIIGRGGPFTEQHPVVGTVTMTETTIFADDVPHRTVNEDLARRQTHNISTVATDAELSARLSAYYQISMENQNPGLSAQHWFDADSRIEEASIMAIIKTQEDSLMGKYQPTKDSTALDPDRRGRVNDDVATFQPHSSFYQAALEDYKRDIGVSVATENKKNPETRLFTMSSFYEAALAAGRVPSSNFGQSLLEYEGLPHEVSRMMIQGSVQSASTSNKAEDSKKATSSFYEAALEANQLNATGTRSLPSDVNPVSSFYRHALHAATTNYNFQRPDARLVTPDDVSNQGNQAVASSFYRAALMAATQPEDETVLDSKSRRAPQDPAIH